MLNKPVSNPMLCGAIELMRAEDTPEHKQMFMDEMLKGHYLTPVVVTPAPEPDANGKMQITPGSKIQFPLLATQEGQQFFMAFTDMEELKKWNAEENQLTFTLTFHDYAGMLLSKDKEGNVSPALGFVINPYSANIIIPRNVVAQIVASGTPQNKN